MNDLLSNNIELVCDLTNCQRQSPHRGSSAHALIEAALISCQRAKPLASDSLRKLRTHTCNLGSNA